MDFSRTFQGKVLCLFVQFACAQLIIDGHFIHANNDILVLKRSAPRSGEEARGGGGGIWERNGGGGGGGGGGGWRSRWRGLDLEERNNS